MMRTMLGLGFLSFTISICVLCHEINYLFCFLVINERETAMQKHSFIQSAIFHLCEKNICQATSLSQTCGTFHQDTYQKQNKQKGEQERIMTSSTQSPTIYFFK